MRPYLRFRASLDDLREVVEFVAATGHQPSSPLPVMHRLDGHRHLGPIPVGLDIDNGHPAALSFELAPLDDHDEPLFRAVHHVRLADQGASTQLSLTIRVTDAGPDAMTALAGMQIGWGQLLDKLAAIVDDGGSPSG